MNKKQKLFAAALFSAGLMMTSTAASALEGARAPGNISNKAEQYISTRLADDRGARYRVSSKPYQVKAELRRGQSYDCWALDVRVRSDLGAAGRGADRYTVIFHNGRAVALKRDLRTRIVKVQSEQRFAAN
ncbi:hypothetical protein [Parvularcula sp. IMCC14364]|uniref:hypothetical protein n=1 Tax=Parvularcula sp. IMCC14364 TaxID=3067902 RepID=UPI0027406F3E|nr:hypothetical protein [Parvularcula sp. IMCC14364]